MRPYWHERMQARCHAGAVFVVALAVGLLAFVALLGLACWMGVAA